MLCPLNIEQNKFVPRLCYEEVLQSSIEINDLSGYSCEIKEGKRIIHFSKMRLKEAISIYEDIIGSDPERYSTLESFMNSIVENKLLTPLSRR